MIQTPRGSGQRPYDLTFETRPEFLYARIAAARINRSMKLDYLAEVLLKCAQTRCKQILLDRNIPGLVDEEEFHATVEDFVQASENVTIAFVNPHTQIEKDLRRFVTSGRRRGGKFRYFKDRQKADKWLLSLYQ